VLAAFARHMPLRDIIDNINILAARGVLEPTFPQASDIAQRISDQQAVLDERLVQLHFYILIN
jgi:hypothetical protein